MVAPAATWQRSAPPQLGFRPPAANPTLCRPEGRAAPWAGTCLNVGCIPSKALLHTSHLFEEANHSFEAQGISVGKATIDVPAMKGRKDGVVNQLTAGIKGLFKKNKVTFLAGHGSFVAKEGDLWKVKVGDEEVLAKNVIVPPAPRPVTCRTCRSTRRSSLDNEGALNQESVPKKLAIIGAGVIGLEMAPVGVASVPKSPSSKPCRISWRLPTRMSPRKPLKLFHQAGPDIQMGVKIGDIKTTKKSFRFRLRRQGWQGTEAGCRSPDRLHRSHSEYRRPERRSGWPPLTDRGFVEVDGHCRTNLPGVWAIGDVVRGPMLAHKASEEGVMVAELMAGQRVTAISTPFPGSSTPIPGNRLGGQDRTGAQGRRRRLQGRQARCLHGQWPGAGHGRAERLHQDAGLRRPIAILGVRLIRPMRPS